MSRAVMEPTKGLKIAKFGLANLIKVADLIYFDGPILSWFRDTESNDYLFLWVDADDQNNRWMVFKVANDILQKYIKGKITLYAIVMNPLEGFMYLVDISSFGDELHYDNTVIVNPSILPESYLPEIISYYEFEPIFVREDINTNDRFYAINIDRDWSLEDLHELPQSYSQIYSFMYNLELNRQGRAITARERSAFAKYPWKGGFSTVNFYNDLHSMIPAEDKPRVVQLQYASPGFIKLSLHTPIAEYIRNSIQAYIASMRQIDEKYAFVMQFQREYKFTRQKVEEYQIEPEVMNIIVEYTEELAQMLRYPYVAATNQLTNNRLLSLRILLAHYRRIKILAAYQIEGRATY